MVYLFFKVRKEDIWMIKFILESYENLMTLSTVDKEMGKVQITCAADFIKDCEMILEDLGQKFPMVRLDEPSHVSQGNY